MCSRHRIIYLLSLSLQKTDGKWMAGNLGLDHRTFETQVNYMFAAMYRKQKLRVKCLICGVSERKL